MSGNKILVVEDNPGSLKLMLTLFQIQGYDVRMAESAEGGFELLEQFKPNLILIDIQLPGMDGLEMTRRLRANSEYKDTPILAITAYSTRVDKTKALDAGCNEFIAKPIDTRELPDVIASYCDGSRG